MLNATPTSVYKYYDEYGILIYVGITSRGAKRQSEHNKDKSWWAHVASQTVEHFDSRGEALDHEEWLIVSHEPPFNTQHNRNQRSAMASYQAFRRLPSLQQSPEELLRDSGKQIPLLVVSHEGNDLRVATPPKFATLVPSLTLDRNVKCISGTTRCGTVVNASMRGVSLDINLNVRKGMPVDGPFMRVKTVLAKGGPQFVGHNVQLS